MALLRVVGVTLPLLPALLTLGAAVVHRGDLGSETYVHSPLVSVEILGAALTLLALLVQGPVHLVFGFRRRWGWLAAGVGAALLSAGSLLIAFVLDAATLVYLT